MRFNYFLLMFFFPFLINGQSVKGFKQEKDGIRVTFEQGELSICPLAENAVRIRFYKNELDTLPELIFNSEKHNLHFNVKDSRSKIELKTNDIITVLDKLTGQLSFYDKQGKVFLCEKINSRKLIVDSVIKEPCLMSIFSA